MDERWGLIKVFVANVSIMVTLTYLISVLHKYALHRATRERKQGWFLLTAILSGWVSMYFGVQMQADVILDLRFIPILVAPMFLSRSLSILFLAAGIGVGRFWFGISEAAVVGFVNVLLLGAVAAGLNVWMRRSRWSFFRRMSVSVLLINIVNVSNSAFLGVYGSRTYFLTVAPVVFPLSVALSAFFVFIVRDFQLEYARRASLVEEASKDHLTKLFNVRTFERYYQTLMEHAAKEGRAVSLAFIDIDYFKSINDTYGHAVGDLVLRKVGEMLSTHTRWNDFIARYGGEEFIMVLPDCRGEEAMEVVERMRISIAGQSIKVKKHTVSVTVSIGVASFPEVSPEQLIETADQALYRAKREGRNRSIYLMNEL